MTTFTHTNAPTQFVDAAGIRFAFRRHIFLISCLFHHIQKRPKTAVRMRNLFNFGPSKPAAALSETILAMCQIVKSADEEWQQSNDSNRSMLRRFPRLSLKIMSLLAFY